jgi:hypothetical protein
MTLEEKVGQMTQLSIEMISKGVGNDISKPHAIDTAKLRNVIVNLGVGLFSMLVATPTPLAIGRMFLRPLKNTVKSHDLRFRYCMELMLFMVQTTPWEPLYILNK